MNRAALIEEILERVERLGSFSEAMREDERARGFEPIRPGERDWFPADDWTATDVVSVKGKRVRLVAICAKREGAGALSRMITGIARAGLTPVVVEPMLAMGLILARWGWRPRMLGRGAERQETWEPTREWLRARARGGAA